MTVLEQDLATLLSVAGVVLYALAACAMIHAIQTRRRSQSALAWSIALLSLPLIALPLYVVFGRNRFHGYVQAHRSAFALTSPQARELNQALDQHAIAPAQVLSPLFRAVRELTGLPFTSGNQVDLLVDGERTFAAILEAIDTAENYVLVQFYIVRPDRIGTQLKRAMLDRAAKGVAVYFLYDEIGCVRLPQRYLRELRAGGVHVSGFKTTRGPGNRWQINFRNHRKIVIVDGRYAFVGGMNVGDEYLGRHRRLGRWRDTHVRMAGPTVQMAQISFVEDWFWANRTIPPEIEWTPRSPDGASMTAAVVRTGPADERAVCPLLHLEAFNLARERLWLAAGYFVPEEPVIRALQLAAMRGVDVRVLLSRRSDSRLARLASLTYVGGLVRAGVKVFQYGDGVMHQKVFLVDDILASVGSINMDARSFSINFEITALVADRRFAESVATMLEDDFAASEQFFDDALAEKPAWFQLAARAANLAAPML